MKAQKLGLVLGMNMAVACMMMQGCKAHRAGTEPLPSNTTVVAAAPVETAVPAATPTETATVETPVAASSAEAGTGPSATSTPVAASTQPSGIVIEQGQAPAPVVKLPKLPPPKSNVRTVPALPKAGSKPAVAPKGTLTTPVPAVAAGSSAAAGTGFVYTVKPGDQLFAVSRKYNVLLSAIVKANPGLNPDRIRIGQKITIPGVTGPSATAVAAVPAATTPMAATVTPKTTMLAAASTAPTAASTVAPVKTMPAFKPYVGATKEYTVKSGDSLGKIACESGISIRALKELNKLTKDSVRIGQKLLVPAEKVVKDTKVAAKAEEPKSVVTPKPAPTATKKVEPAKTVEKAATEPAVAPKPAVEPVKVDAAAPAPEKQEAAPAPAVEQKAAAPAPAVEQKTAPAPVAEPKAEAPAAAGLTYTVKEGDDLVSVSINFGVSPSQLMDLNGIKAGEGLKPGQVLKIPAGAKPSAD